MSLINKKHLVLISILSFILTACGSGSGSGSGSTEVVTLEPTIVELTTLVDGSQVETAELIRIGEILYNDVNLSTPIGQSCASCHDKDTGFDDPNETNPSSLGADSISFGSRNSPTASYAALIPESQTVLRTPPGGGQPQAVLMGGLFLDGRASSLEEQAKGPFLNAIEMGNSSESDVIAKIRTSNYAADFEALFGANVLNDVTRSYDYIADAIAAFERTDVFSPFNSKFDQVQNGTAIYTVSEQRGEQLFSGRAGCDRCHKLDGQSLFSDFQFHNIGVPSNDALLSMINDPQFIDLGLAEVTLDGRDEGRFRTSSLRNIAITAPYMHNGVFGSLREVLEFYNTRDTTFPLLPEVTANLDRIGNIGDLRLSNNDINDLIAFLETLTDKP